MNEIIPNNTNTNALNMKKKYKNNEDIDIEQNWIYYKNGIDLLSETCKTQQKQNKLLYMINIILFFYSMIMTFLYLYQSIF